jgi:hypothetical protein
MAMLSFCGIDVSKDRLDVMVLPEQQSFAVRNDAAGWAELIARLRGFTIAAIGLEASGGYERGAMRALLAAGLPACQVNPFRWHWKRWHANFSPTNGPRMIGRAASGYSPGRLKASTISVPPGSRPG